MAEGFDYWIIGTQYLRLAEAACGELVQRENVTGVIFNGEIDWDEYLEVTKWSDQSIGIAVLFNFLHGVEVLVKGFLLSQGQDPAAHRHKLSKLVESFESNFPNSNMAILIRKYTLEIEPNSPFGTFLTSNGASIDDWYEALKYPESNRGKLFTHDDLKYGGAATLCFWRDLGETAANIRKEAVSLSRAIQ